eukprot:1178458-Prorocentrum_minimum.AAC.1
MEPYLHHDQRVLQGVALRTQPRHVRQHQLRRASVTSTPTADWCDVRRRVTSLCGRQRRTPAFTINRPATRTASPRELVVLAALRT